MEGGACLRFCVFVVVCRGVDGKTAATTYGPSRTISHTHPPLYTYTSTTPKTPTGAQAGGGVGSTLGSALPPVDAAPGHGSIHLAVPSTPDALPLPATTPTPATALTVRLFSEAGAAAAFVASDPSALAAYQSPSGVMLFVLSLLMTRGVRRVKEEMDDAGNALTGRFGHCTQEVGCGVSWWWYRMDVNTAASQDRARAPWVRESPLLLSLKN